MNRSQPNCELPCIFLSGTAHAQGILLHNVTKPVGGLPNLCAPRAGDVDTASCTAFTVAQATSSCGLDVKSHSGQKYYTRYTQIKHVQCNGQTCHVDVATDAESLRAVVDCHQTAGDQASCMCGVYFDFWSVTVKYMYIRTGRRAGIYNLRLTDSTSLSLRNRPGWEISNNKTWSVLKIHVIFILRT